VFKIKGKGLKVGHILGGIFALVLISILITNVKGVNDVLGTVGTFGLKSIETLQGRN